MLISLIINVCMIVFVASKCVCGNDIHSSDPHSICIECRIRPANKGEKVKYHCQTRSDGSEGPGRQCKHCAGVTPEGFRIWMASKLDVVSEFARPLPRPFLRVYYKNYKYKQFVSPTVVLSAKGLAKNVYN